MRRRGWDRWRAILGLALAGELAAAGPLAALTAPAPGGAAGGAGVAAPAPSSPAAPRAMPEPAAGRLLLCASDGGYRRCPADTSAGVTLVRELSSGLCAARSTWGFDGAGIWVDKGCRAEFRLGATESASTPAERPAGEPRAGAGAEKSGGGIDAGTAALVILGAVVAGGAAAVLLSGDEEEKNRKRKAVALCDQRLDRLVRERNGRGGKILRIERARQRGGELALEAQAKAEWRRGADTRGRIECRVDFRGKNEVVSFRQSGLWRGR